MQHRGLLAVEESYKRLLESLYFPDIHARQEGIEDAHQKTFEWVFDKPDSEVQLWHNFINWLEEGRGTYWISGKAGSGKSTLMNFICQDPRTGAALRIWSRGYEVFMPSFFFWSPGTQLQKSLAGLLRSLIYQIMDKFPDLMPVLTSAMGPAQNRLQQIPTWTEHRLRATLQQLLSDRLEKYRLCIFIDGLDEFSGDHTILLDLIRSLRQNTRVKFCLSSRPYQSFRDEFGSSVMLKLQDLTEPDIRKYASDKLGRVKRRASQVAHSSFKLEDTVDTIVEKGEGVFLWVNLAVRDQLEGIRNGDDAEQLRERLKLLPEEIEELYGHMLQKIDKVYGKEVAQYLQLILHLNSQSLFGIALAVYKRLDEVVLFSPDITISDIRNHCKFIGTRIATTCKGFLEVQEQSSLHEWQKNVNDPSSTPEAGDVSRNFSRNLLKSVEDQRTPLEQRGDLIETKFYQARTRVDFLHRTAVDFFKDNEQGKIFLETNAPINPHPRISYIKAELAYLVVFRVQTEDFEVQRAIRYIMVEAGRVEKETGVAQVALMDLLDRSLAMLSQRSPGQPSDLHWCRAWDIPRAFGLEPQQTSQPSNDSILSRYPVDFLGFAAWCGLHKYVEHTLDSQSVRQNPSTIDYLLCCTVNGFVYGLRLGTNSYMKLVSALLERGANPNTKALEGTVWGSFLQRLYRMCFYTFANWLPSEISELLVTGCWGTVRKLVESGANLNEDVCFILSKGLPGSMTHSGTSTLDLSSYRISLHLSASSVLQQCFANTPVLSEIENACIASGASLYFECTEILFAFWMGCDRLWVDPRLSEQQLKQFSNALDRNLRASAGKAWERRSVFNHQIVELFQELDIDQLCEQTRRKDDEDEDEDEDSDEVSSDEWSTTSSGSTTPEVERSSHPVSISQAEH